MVEKERGWGQKESKEYARFRKCNQRTQEGCTLHNRQNKKARHKLKTRRKRPNTKSNCRKYGEDEIETHDLQAHEIM